MTFDVDVAPRFDYGREPHETQLTEDGAVFEGSRTALTVHLVREPEDERLASARIDEHGRRARRGHAARRARSAASCSRPASLRAAARDPGGRGRSRCSTRRVALLAATGSAQSTYSGRWREMREPLGDHPQAHDLRADRRPGRGADRGAARAGRRRTQLGLPLHLGPRRVVLGVRAARAGLHRGGGRASPAGCGDRVRREAQRDGAAR